MTNAIWRERQLTDQQLRLQQQLTEQLPVSPVLAKLYAQRNLATQQDIERFINPKESELHDPFLYKDMDKAVERLNKAIRNGEKILIYGDYDVDGTTSVALVYRYLHHHYTNLGFYVPERDTEGYGVSIKGVDFAANNKFTLIIALDCGIKDTESINYGKEKGIDFIICDHHNPDEELPEAVAVLDAKRPDNTYPYTELSGCGVGYKFMQAYAITNHHDPQLLEPLYDLLALSIASDIVPLTGENRILLSLGLRRLNNNPSLGLAMLLHTCELKQGEIDINDIVFKIGPRINASGRIDSANEAIRLMITEDKQEALDCCKAINEHNQQRRDLDRQTTEEALKQLAEDPAASSYFSTVVYDANWPKGVVGIVASRLIEKYYKPTIVLTESNGLISGSARSVAGFDLYSAIKACAGDLEAFGGHTFAAGLSMKPEKLNDFKLHFEEYVATNISNEQKVPTIEYDQEISFSQITGIFNDVRSLQPYGQDNPQPVFVTRGVRDSGGSRTVGQKGEHLRLEVTDGSNNVKMTGIAFNKGGFYRHLHEGGKVDICYTLEENVFRNNRTIQLHVKDIQLL